MSSCELDSSITLREAPASLADWQKRLVAAYGPEAPVHLAPWPVEQDPSQPLAPLRPLLRLASPLAVAALAEVRAAAAMAHDGQGRPLVDVSRWVADWLVIAETQLLPLVLRTLTLELQVARLQDRLDGDTPEARFAAFAAALGQRNVSAAVLDEYPVLARQLAEHVASWQFVACQLIGRLQQDLPELQRLFGGERPLGAVTRIQACGDRHRGGQTVLLCAFASGIRVVYKPRSLAVEHHFQQLLQDLNARGFEPAFRTLAVLDRGTHGWVEFLTASPCQDREALSRFYRRQGANLALLYALDATDFHYENLIAAGEHPVLLDLEALFHPARLDAEGEGGAHQQASDRLCASVLRVGLLPWRGPDDGQGRSLDIGGLTARADGAKGPLQLGIAAAGRDEMRLVRKPARLGHGQHLPELAGHAVRLQDHLADLESGFDTMYRLLMSDRAALVAPGGPVHAFGNDETRVILRGSEAYARLLQESLHPDLLRDAADRDRHFDQLRVAFAHTDRFEGIVASEKDDLRRGDIPIFTARPAGLDLWDSQGRCHSGQLTEPPIQRVNARLQGFDPHDLAFQLWLMRIALAVELDSSGGGAHSAGIEATGSSGSGIGAPVGHAPAAAAPDERALLISACEVGDRLVATAFRMKGSATWVGLTLGRHRQVLRHLPPDLYSGVAGVACFLAQLGAQTGRQHYTDLASEAVETVLSELDPWMERAPELGAYTGAGGIVYALVLLGQSLRRQALFERAHAVVASLATRIDDDDQFDVLGGVAGLAASILALHEVSPRAPTLQVAYQCGEHLVAHAQAQGSGLGWVVGGLDAPALGGFSHGAAGISWALSKLAKATGAPHFRQVARQALVFDRSLRDAETGEWRDLRGGAKGTMSAWCHGSTGIGLARLDSLQCIDDDITREEIQTALARTWARGLGHHTCLCHGDAGNLDLFLESRLRGVGDASLLDQADSRLMHSLRAAAGHNFSGGGTDTPGLMGGLAGVGWGLLRAARPSDVPSVLLLQARPTRCVAGVSLRPACAA